MKSEQMNSLRGWMRTVALLVSGTLMVLGTAVSGATLDVELDIRTRAETSVDKASSQKDIVILVLDRSGSMNDPATAVNRSSEKLDDVMKEMLRNRLDMLAETRPEAKVWTVSFSSSISAPIGPYLPREANRIIKELASPYGRTLLYDAVARAVDFGETLLEKDPMARVGVYVYTDGDNLPPSSGYWTDTIEVVERGLLGEKTVKKEIRVPVRYDGPHADDQFMKDYDVRIQSLAKAGKLSLETGCWLGEGKRPIIIENKRKDEYPLELMADGTSLKNPATSSEQGLKARLLVPLPARYAKDLEKLEAALVFEAGGRSTVTRFSLAPGKKKVKLVFPDGLPTKAFVGQLQVKRLPDVWKSLALAEPEPVELSFAEPGALSLSGVIPRGEHWTALGVPVEFSATASEDAEVAWSIDGKVAGKGTFEKTFDKAGTYEVVATAQKAGFRPASAECTIHAMDTAVKVEVVAPAGVQVGQKVSFAAKASGGENVSWWVDGQPAAGKGAQLKDWTFDASGQHTAKARVYFGHGLSGEDEAYFTVSQAPYVSIDTPWSGKEFGPGEEITAVAKVEGGFDRLEWTLGGPEESTITAEVDREARTSRPVAFKPGKGGSYELMAVAEGPAGRLESQPVRFSVAREDAWVRIDEPASGASVQTGTDIVLKASARGEEANSIRWTVTDGEGATLFSASRPTEGGVSQCAFRPSETLGNGAALFIVAEAEGDPALRAESDIKTRCSNCLAIGAVLSLSHDGDERRNYGRGERIVAELQNLRGDVRDIEWTFGEDGHRSGRVVEWDGWTDYNVYPVTVAGRCGKCGALHDFGQASVVIEPRPISAAFEIKEHGSYYTAGGKLHLASTCTATNDIADFIWTVDGQELADFRGKPQATVELPFKPCDMVLSLTVRGKDDNAEEFHEQDIRVRFGWVAVVLFLLAALLVWYPLWKLLKDNGAAGWRIVAWKRPAPLPGARGLEKERKACRNEDPDQCIRKWWSLWEKQAKIPPEALGLDLEDMGGVSTDEGKVIVNPTPPKIGGLAELIPDPSADLSLPGIPGVEFYRYYPSYEAQNRCRARNQTMKCVRILLDTRSRDYRYVTKLWLLSAALLFAVVWASLRYAI